MTMTITQLKKYWNRLPEAAPFGTHFAGEIARVNEALGAVHVAQVQLAKLQRRADSAIEALDNSVQNTAKSDWTPEELATAGFDIG